LARDATVQRDGSASTDAARQLAGAYFLTAVPTSSDRSAMGPSAVHERGVEYLATLGLSLE
jgi:hypothetical protein